jgi:hypothetical protein
MSAIIPKKLIWTLSSASTFIQHGVIIGAIIVVTDVIVIDSARLARAR